MSFSIYLLSIAGIVILGVIIDLMMTDGQMQKYIKSIFVIFVMFVIVSPLPKLLNLNVNFSLPATSQVVVEENLINNINKQKKSSLQNAIISHFSANGVSGCVVEVEIDDKNRDFVVKRISIYIQKLVIENNYLNINKYEILRKLVLECVDVSEDVIEFYE